MGYLYPLWAAVAIAELMTDPAERRRWLEQFDPSSRTAIERELDARKAVPPATSA